MELNFYGCLANKQQTKRCSRMRRINAKWRKKLAKEARGTEEMLSLFIIDGIKRPPVREHKAAKIK